MSPPAVKEFIGCSAFLPLVVVRFSLLLFRQSNVDLLSFENSVQALSLCCVGLLFVFNFLLMGLLYFFVYSSYDRFVCYMYNMYYLLWPAILFSLLNALINNFFHISNIINVLCFHSLLLVQICDFIFTISLNTDISLTPLQFHLCPL